MLLVCVYSQNDLVRQVLFRCLYSDDLVIFLLLVIQVVIYLSVVYCVIL